MILGRAEVAEPVLGAVDGAMVRGGLEAFVAECGFLDVLVRHVA